MTYLARLAARTAAVGSHLCLGLDPTPDGLPPGFSRDISGVERFARLVLDVALPYAAAVKPNLAFFEAFGSAGLAALERLRAQVPADVPFIADAKRGDIGSTAERHAVAIFESLGADAVTASPYLGRDAIAPFLAHEDCFVYVLCRTSNAGAAELQALPVDGEPLYLRVARMAAAWSAGSDRIGVVVGATAPVELSRVRLAGPGLAFLVPGVGSQGGDVTTVLADGPAKEGSAGAQPGGGLLVNVSRGISGAFAAAAQEHAAVSVERSIANAAEDWAQRLRC